MGAVLNSLMVLWLNVGSRGVVSSDIRPPMCVVLAAPLFAPPHVAHWATSLHHSIVCGALRPTYLVLLVVIGIRVDATQNGARARCRRVPPLPACWTKPAPKTQDGSRTQLAVGVPHPPAHYKCDACREYPGATDGRRIVAARSRAALRNVSRLSPVCRTEQPGAAIRSWNPRNGFIPCLKQERCKRDLKHKIERTPGCMYMYMYV